MVNTRKFSEFVDGGDIQNDETTVGLAAGANTKFNNPWTFLAPGTTAERPSPSAAVYFRLRWNTTLSAYEYLDSNGDVWLQIDDSGSVLSVTGTANEIDVDNTDPQNPILSLSSTLDAPGTFTIQGTVALDSVIDDDTFATATDSNIPTSESVKAYVDNVAGGLVDSVTGTANEVDVDNIDPANPVVSLSATLDAPGTFTIQASTAVDEIINDDTMVTATATNLGTALSIKNYVDGLDSGSVKSVTGTANEVDVDNTDAQNPIFSLSSTLDAPGTFTIQTSTAVDEIINDDTMAAATVTNLATSLSIKNYVDGLITADVQSVTGTVNQIDVDNIDPQNPILSLSSTLEAPGTVAVGNLLLNTNTLSSTDVNGDINLTPNGAGDLVLDGVNWPQADGNAGEYLQTDGAGQTSWQPVAGSGTVNAGTANQITYYATTGDAVSGLTGANSAMLVTNSTGVPAMTASLTDGQVVIGDTSGTPVPATLTPGTGISIANGAGSITISATGGGFAVATIAGTTQTAAVNTMYIALNSGQTTLTLPSTFSVGDSVVLVGSTANVGGWIVQAASGDTVRVNNSTTSAGGTVTSSATAGQTIEMVCDVQDTSWVMVDSASVTLTTA
jgi:hypothetical protein